MVGAPVHDVRFEADRWLDLCDVIWAGGYDPDGRGYFVGSLNEALQSKSNGTNPVIGVFSGEWDDTNTNIGGDISRIYINTSRTDDWMLIGVGPTRPYLHLTGNIAKTGSGEGGSMTLRNLELEGRGIVHAAPKMDAIAIQDVFLHDYTLDGLGSSDMDPGYRLTVTLTDFEVTRCGQGNTKHNIYVSTRDCDVYGYRINSYASNGSIACKIKADNFFLEDCYFGTVADFDFPETGPWSSSLLDFPACGYRIIRNCYFQAAKYLVGEGSTRMIHMRARRSINAADQPPYGSADFNDQNFWLDPESYGWPAEFTTLVENPTFHWVDIDGRAASPGVANDGTYPRKNLGGFGACSAWLNVPAAWFERSVARVTNPTWIGMSPTYDMDFTECTDEEETDVVRFNPTPTRFYFADGVQFGRIVMKGWGSDLLIGDSVTAQKIPG